VVKEGFTATSRKGVFAGGDIVTGAATVIEAMGAGKKAAHEIDAYIKKK
jgi:glutamate synthase (NADPH/NADH) small chain